MSRHACTVGVLTEAGLPSVILKGFGIRAAQAPWNFDEKQEQLTAQTERRSQHLDISAAAMVCGQSADRIFQYA